MNIETELRELPRDASALDPMRVIAGARRRRRRRGVLSAVAASAGVAAVTAVGVVVTQDRPATSPPVAATPSAATPSVVRRYSFQNARPAVATLAAGVEVKVGPYLYFKTKGTQWALISRRPGEPVSAPFGWRETVGNSNVGDGTTPGIQSAEGTASSVFKSAKAATVVYTAGRKAWFGQVRRLAGIPGWVAASATTPVAAESVFVYDAGGRLIAAFGDPAEDPLHR